MLAIILAIILLLLLGFSIWLVISLRRLSRLELKTLAKTPCPSCSHVFGENVALSAKDEYMRRCHKRMKDNPEVMINFSRIWKVKCSTCGAESDYDSKHLTLQAKAET